MQGRRRLFKGMIGDEIKRKFTDMFQELEKMEIDAKTFKEFSMKLNSHINNLDNFVANLYEQSATIFEQANVRIREIKKMVNDPEVWEKNPLKEVIEDYEEVIKRLIDVIGYLTWILKMYDLAVEKYEGTINFQIQNEAELQKLKMEKDFFDRTVERITNMYENELRDRLSKMEDMILETKNKLHIYDKKFMSYDESIQILNKRIIDLFNQINMKVVEEELPSVSLEVKKPERREERVKKQEKKEEKAKKPEKKEEKEEVKKQEQEVDDEEDDFEDDDVDDEDILDVADLEKELGL